MIPDLGADPRRYGEWTVLRRSGPAGALHDASVASMQDAVRRITVLEASKRALVLGASQAAADVDDSAARRAGVDVARRRSGGSAVLVGPEEVVWVDVFVPADDVLFQPDISKAARWLGGLWAAAIGASATVWEGPMRHNPWSKVVCFAGLGPGEVTMGGRKVVGISQRRTQSGALFQSAALLNWDPGLHAALLRKPEEAKLGQLNEVACGLGKPLGEHLATAVVGLLLDE
ncbi:MAG: lipoyl protein ligase domain-containing protein [Acidimicrobiales bacterium]